MLAFKIITDPKAFEIMADETRRRIIHLLRARELTVSQIAENLDKTPQAIYHQIRKMVEAGLVEVAREERVDHFIETYYRATAEVFNFSHGQGTTTEMHDQRLRNGIKALDKLGFNVQIDEATLDRIIELFAGIDKAGIDRKLEAKVQKIEEIDLLSKQDLLHVLSMVTMTDTEFNKQVDRQRELRTLLKSSLSEPPTLQARHAKDKAK